MRQYKSYMDHVKVSGDLHRRLAELEGPGKRPVPWVKYASLAAALALVCGLGGFGAWAAHINSRRALLRSDPSAYQGVYPEVGGVNEPDIALEEPGDAAQPGMRTLGGYEVAEDGAAAYYVLPYIEYGPPSGSVMNSSLARPDGELRDAGRDDVLALVGGEEALTAHLNWGECEFRGTVGFEADGTVCMMSLWGEGADTAFSLEVSPGRIPPTCYVVIGEERTITDVWGVEVSGVNRAGAYGDAERGVYMDVSRELQFIAKGVGCRLKVYGTQDQAVEELASRFVRWAVLEGLDLSAISPDGAKPVEADPGYSVGEPNWDDSGEGWTCPGCGVYIEAGVKHDHTQDGSPRERTGAAPRGRTPRLTPATASSPAGPAAGASRMGRSTTASRTAPAATCAACAARRSRRGRCTAMRCADFPWLPRPGPAKPAARPSSMGWPTTVRCAAATRRRTSARCAARPTRRARPTPAAREATTREAITDTCPARQSRAGLSSCAAAGSLL